MFRWTGMLLKYVCSYVTKAHDAYNSDALYTVHTTPYQAAFCFLNTNYSFGARDVAFFIFEKIAWALHQSKRFYVPLPQFAATNTILLAFWSTPKSLGHLSLLQWLQEFDTSKIPPKPYKRGETLGGTRQTSVFRDEYFFQDMLLHMPHRSTNDFDIPDVEEIPQVYKIFCVCITPP